jgi:hypothetical protein
MHGSPRRWGLDSASLSKAHMECVDGAERKTPQRSRLPKFEHGHPNEPAWPHRTPAATSSAAFDDCALLRGEGHQVSLFGDRWTMPTKLAIVVSFGIVALWCATGVWWVAWGNDHDADIRLACGSLTINIGRKPSVFEKWTCAKGLEFGTAYEPGLSLGDLPWLWTFDQPWSVMGELPLWLVCPPLALLVLLVSSLRRRSKRGDFCLKCGYNLAGNVSGRCPECGSAVAPRRQAPR